MNRQVNKAEQYAAYLASPEWRERRGRAIARAGGRCQLCNSSKQLNIHLATIPVKLVKQEKFPLPPKEYKPWDTWSIREKKPKRSRGRKKNRSGGSPR